MPSMDGSYAAGNEMLLVGASLGTISFKVLVFQSQSQVSPSPAKESAPEASPTST